MWSPIDMISKRKNTLEELEAFEDKDIVMDFFDESGDSNTVRKGPEPRFEFLQPMDKQERGDYALDICLKVKIDLLKFNNQQRFLISALIVMGMFIPYAWIQEYLMQSKSDERPNNLGAFLTLSTFIFWVIFSGVEGLSDGGLASLTPRAPFRRHLTISLLSTVSMTVSNVALQFVNYPTKVLFKTSKAIPVMFAGVVFFKKRYVPAEYLATLFLIIGVIWFSYGNMLVSPSFSFIGYFLMAMGLLSDSICQNLNEKTMTEFQSSEREMIFYTAAMGTCWLLLLLLPTGELGACLVYFSLSDWFLIFLFSWFSFIGNKVLFTITKANGIFISLFLTSVRKLLTILLSFLIFPKPFTWHYVFAGFVAFLGISLNIYVQTQKSLQKKKVFFHEKSSSV